ncbi:hypothetical protein BDY24DRAFT_225698 [Mrakia frigida]|uniref:uncharacterized protein n=1 Tax=Mrakia frigida TaxID=29902 RepID=UPI003FCBF37F
MASEETTASDLFGSPSSPDVHDPFDDLLHPQESVTTTSSIEVEDETAASRPQVDQEEELGAPIHEDEAVDEPVALQSAEAVLPIEEKEEAVEAAEKEEEVEEQEQEQEGPGDLDPVSSTPPAPATTVSEEPSSATSFHTDSATSPSFPPPAVDSSSSATEQPTQTTQELDALFSTEEEGPRPEEWLQDEVTIPSSDLAPVVPSSSPPPSSPPATSAQATDDLFASENGPDETDDWLAEETVEDPKEEQSKEELHLSSSSPILQALPTEPTLPQATSPTVLPASPIFHPSKLDPTPPPPASPLPSAPTMSDLFSSSEDTSDDWLTNHIDPQSSTIELEAPILDFGATVEHVEYSIPAEAADTNELFGAVEDEEEDLFGGLGERAAVVEESSQEMASNSDLTFDPSPYATSGLSFDDSEDPFLAPSPEQEQSQPEVAGATDETDYSTQGYYDESGEWIWFDVVEPSVAPVEEEIAVSSPSAGATWPSVPGASLLTRQGSADKLLRSPAVEQGAFEFGLSESEARRTPLSSPFLPSGTFPIPEPEDITPFVALQAPPLGRSASSNPYASGSSTKTANPYATSNPYAAAAAPHSANPYSTPIPASANPYGPSSTSSPYGLAPASSPNPYASPTSPNPYFNAPSVYSPPVATPPKPAPPPFQRQTTQTYNAYDPPEMPIIPVRRAKAAPPPGGVWGAQAAQVPTPYNAGFSPVAATPPKPAGPPPPPPKRVDSWSQRPVPPPAAAAPPSRPTSAFDPPPQAFGSPLREQHPPPPPKTFSPPPPRPPPAGRGPSFNAAPPPQSVAAFHPTMPSALGMSASSLLAGKVYGEEDGGETPTIGRPDGRIGGQTSERTFSEEEDDGGEGGGGNWKNDERDEEMEVLEGEAPGRSSSDLPNGATSMDAPRWGQPPPPRTTTPSHTRSVASPPPGPPPPRPSSTVSNASSRYGASQHAPPPLPPVQPPPALDQGYQPYASNGSAPYARSMVGSPPPRPPSASQGRAVRPHPPPLVSNNSTFAPPPPSHTPPPPRPASTSNAYASYGMTSTQSSPQRIPGYSPVQPTTSLPPHAPSHGNYSHPRNTSAPYDASQTSTRAPYAAVMVAASVSSTSLASQAGGVAPPSAYAPDVVHSLADDPLGRASEKFKKVPVMSFGFGGKVAVCYPSLGGGGYGGGFVGGGEDSDSRDGRSVRIKALEEIVPETGGSNFFLSRLS